MKNAGGAPTKSSICEFFGLGVALLLYLIAVFCGWFGILEGWILGFLSPFLFLLVAFFYVMRTGFLFKKAARKATLNFILMLLCICIFLCSMGRTQNPFERAFEARVKHEYKNYIPEIQTWGIATLKMAKQELYPLHESDWPDWIKIAHFPKPRVIIYNVNNTENEPTISIIWGGGMVGGNGLIVGNSTLRINNEKWADGIYYFVGQ